MLTYLHADGDGVGDKLELLLLDGDVEAAAQHSRAITEGISAAASRLQAAGWRLHFCGGDELLASTDAPVEHGVLAAARTAFRERVGCTISVGLGPSTGAAVTALHRAKLLGRDRIEQSV